MSVDEFVTRAAAKLSPWKLAVDLCLTDDATPLVGEQTVDGIVAQYGTRVLRAAAADPERNGPWLVRNDSWVRPPDYEHVQGVGTALRVMRGSNAGEWRLTSPTLGDVDVDQTETTWAPAGGGGGTPSDATPAALGTAAAGAATAYSRGDHVHAHGSQAGGSLHANAVASGAAGFMSGADKAKLDGFGDDGIPDPLEVANLSVTGTITALLTGRSEIVSLGDGIYFEAQSAAAEFLSETRTHLGVISSSGVVEIGRATGDAELPASITVGERPGSGTHAVDIGGRTLALRAATTTDLDAGSTLTIGTVNQTGITMGRTGQAIDLLGSTLTFNGLPVGGGGGGGASITTAATTVDTAGDTVAVTSPGAFDVLVDGAVSLVSDTGTAQVQGETGVTIAAETGAARLRADSSDKQIELSSTGIAITSAAGSGAGNVSVTAAGAVAVGAVGNLALYGGSGNVGFVTHSLDHAEVVGSAHAGLASPEGYWTPSTAGGEIPGVGGIAGWLWDDNGAGAIRGRWWAPSGDLALTSLRDDAASSDVFVGGYTMSSPITDLAASSGAFYIRAGLYARQDFTSSAGGTSHVWLFNALAGLELLVNPTVHATFTTQASGTKLKLVSAAGIEMDGPLGFFAASATTKPTVTGSRGSNAAVASLLTALATLGLVTDGTTA